VIGYAHLDQNEPRQELSPEPVGHILLPAEWGKQEQTLNLLTLLFLGLEHVCFSMDTSLQSGRIRIEGPFFLGQTGPGHQYSAILYGNDAFMPQK
jgi:hypothetical protein